MASLIVAAGERRGLLGVGFEKMMRSWVILILVAFITGNSSLEPLIEGLYAQIHVNLR